MLSKMMKLMLEFGYGGKCYLMWALWESEWPAQKQSLTWLFEGWSWRSRQLSVLVPRGPKLRNLRPSLLTKVNFAFAEQILAHSEEKSVKLAPSRYQV